MNNKFSVFNFAFIGVIMGLLFLSSCVPMKKQIYLQTHNDSDSTAYVNDNTPSYTLKPGNNLFIKVISIEDEASEYFNMGLGSSGNIYYDASIYLNSYSVNDEGFIELPFIGEVFVNNMTLEEAKLEVQKRTDEYLVNTMLILKLVNYNVSVVGEVNRPGQYKIYQDNINLFELLGLAGDMTTFAKREEVVLVRKTEKGSKVFKLNLLDDKFLESELFYIQPDDIIYVQPVKGRNFAFTAFPYTLVISSISLIIGLFALYK